MVSLTPSQLTQLAPIGSLSILCCFWPAFLALLFLMWLAVKVLQKQLQLLLARGVIASHDMNSGYAGHLNPYGRHLKTV